MNASPLFVVPGTVEMPPVSIGELNNLHNRTTFGKAQPK
jgi:hypothetical protein